MLDTGVRKKTAFIFDAGARVFETMGFSPLSVTVLALLIGLGASVLYLLSFPAAAVITLWVSGYLDAVDGALARRTGRVSPLGSFLDVFFDRIVEAGILLSLGIVHPGSSFPLLCAALSIVLSMTAFLLTGTLVKKESEKSFFYQSGLMERTEGFIIFSLMWLFPDVLNVLGYLCAGLILFTACQRALMTALILRKEKS
ncbi:membrane protein [Spirochaetia bacterium]|nr:membrane protein [Spirochaetia bacterium]